MQPASFKRELYAVFDTWFDTKQFVVSKPLLREMKRVWPKLAKQDNDFRNGYESYGYETPESIYNNLHYISDRWFCAFRLRWLIDGIEGGHIK